MKITEILKKNFIISDLANNSKANVLQELADFLSQKGIIKNPKELHKSLMERENLGSTGIGENVAIPHAKSDEVESITTLFGRSISGLDFDSLDKKPVHFVCLVIAPVNSTGLHLKALARIARLLKNVQLREAILQAKSDDEIYSILVDEDSKFI